MLFLSLPFLWTAPDILHVWLKNPPEYSEEFVRMILIYILIIPFNSVFDKVLLATGKIKKVQVMTSFTTLMNIPLSIIVLYMRLQPYSVYFVYILIGLINFVIKLWNTLIYFPEMKFRYYCSNVLLKVLGVVLISQLLPIAYSMFLYNHTFMSWLCFMLIIEMSLVLCIYILGVTEKERGQFKKFLVKKIHR
jgi:O-antigen/teichoic acid export membrane protein